jgi:two-component system, NarL family, sensor histidine kinase UhpB
MKLRTRLNLVMTGLSVAFVTVLLTAEVTSARVSISEEITAANRVAAQLLGHLATVYPSDSASEPLLEFLDELGRIRAHDITLLSAAGDVLYRSPPSAWKEGREAPAWFARLLTPAEARQDFPLADGGRLQVVADASRAVLDGWDELVWLVTVAVVMLAVLNAAAFWSVDRALKPFPIIADGLARIRSGDLGFRLPRLPGAEAGVIGDAFNAMAEAVEDKVHAERKAREAEQRLEERRELGRLVEQRIEEERRLIAHELHDEFSQSVTAIRSLALAIAARTEGRDAQTVETAKLIGDEAARLYDAMHGLIPRLEPLTLDTLGLAETLENLVRDWQRRCPSVALTARYDVSCDLGHSVTLTIYRIVQEGLINALRHAQPSRVDIHVECDDQRIGVSVADDGGGLPADWRRPGHFGLRGLAERVENVAGTFDVANREPSGVLLRAEIPLRGGADR